MKIVSHLTLIIGIVSISSCCSVSQNNQNDLMGVTFLLRSIDFVNQVNTPTKDLSWTIGSTNGDINGWVEDSGLTILKEEVSDGPALLTVYYLLLDNEIILMHRKYVQETESSSLVFAVKEQIQFFEKKKLSHFLKYAYETNDFSEALPLSLYEQVEIREDNYTYDFTSKSCHALMVRFQHEHVFDIISNVEFSNASYILN